MKYTKLSSIICLLLLILFTINITSCEEKQTQQTMRVQLSKEIPRSITPEGVDLEITKYRVSGTGPAGAEFNMTTNKTSLLLESMAIGSWNISAEGLNQNNLALVRGSTSFNFSQNNSSVTVTLNELIGKGSINVAFSWDPTRITSSSLVITLKPEQGNTTAVTYSPTSINKATGNATFTLNDVSAGSYVLSALLYDGNVAVAGSVEAIRVVGNSHSSGEISFELAEKHGDGTLSIINNAGVPVTCTISGVNESLSAYEAVTATLTPSSSSLKDLKVEWFLNGSSIGSGQSVTFTPEAGFHRLDVVASTNMLGSTGSAAINFEASLLGEVGEPVLAGTVSASSSFTYGGENLIRFLPDGKLLTYTGTTGTFQICSLVRNDLQVETVYTSSNADFQTTGIIDISVFGNTVALIRKNPAGTLILDYNQNTSTLSYNYSCEGDRYYTPTDTVKATSMFGIIPPLNSYNKIRTIAYYETPQKYLVLTRNLDKKIMSEYAWECFDVYCWLGENQVNSYSVSPDRKFSVFWKRGVTPVAVSIFDDDIQDFTLSLRELDHLKDTLLGVFPINKTISAVFAENSIYYYEYDDSPAAATYLLVDTVERESVTDVTSCVYDKNGEFFYFLNTNDSAITTYKVVNERLIFMKETPLSFKPSIASISDDGQILTVSSKNGEDIAIFRIKR